MDELDTALLRMLQNDARRTNRDMAAELEIAPSTCLERIRGLRDRGVISGYHAAVDLKAIDRSTQAIISIKLRPQAMAVATAFQKYVLDLPQTLDMFMVSGGSDFLAHVAVKDTQALRDLVLALAKRQEIADIRSSIVFEHHHRTTVMPLPDH
ncbi:DNA-binding Lrp family transcriptional regulator [Kribbella sp. VKM Ac-2571]|uniref:Lrp/AsnC family transcriptional regulator n=1 Tax=Kribbella sp. VKM Ac-2571 TaxID=2512222 RepID=UPI0010619E46|nr:Lrp/AsnC family transcriptional regulator [Kribbella sp. VKM Ac-2571]TDO69151.1 DNA-binding Lrp family transcriptional regulator [Kribbella sp. VKM Ac-2571]